MSLSDALVIYGISLVTMLISRCAPMFLLKGRDLPDGVKTALGLIPPAAFAALVANDLFSPGMFDAGLGAGLVPLVSALIVVVVARVTSSLVWCALTGVVVYFVLGLLVQMLGWA